MAIFKANAGSLIMVLMPLMLMMVFLLIVPVASEEAPVADEGGGSLVDEESNVELEPATAVLFPWFTEILGVVAFFLLTRFAHVLPYTAVMFVLGTFMGIGASRFDNTGMNQLADSISQWHNINGEVLLLVFLPGLLFKDAYGMNVHLFRVSFWQCVIMAFPMVLAGTSLVALMAYYIFPYGWSFNLAMTFGAILSATDPVAVSALLNEVGAPPRLKVHISGEALLNDGSAIVFFSIFSGMFLAELGVEGVGEEYDWPSGIAKFFRMSIGGALIGIAFGIGLIVLLYLLNRRLNVEENVIQITATITIAYLCFYVADAVAKTSGVIAVLSCGVLTKKLGASMINDRHMMDSFWIMVEHLLNTVLFTLGGVVWGAVIGNDEERRESDFNAQDWGFLILLYVLLKVIRYFLFFAAYPILSRIGLKTNWQETVFTSWSGLRGAVGISLAIALDNEVFSNTENQVYRNQTTTLFGMVGGIAFFTLVINGTLSAPLLKRLGLVESSAIRKKILEDYDRHFREVILQDFIHKLVDLRFQQVDFSLIEHHVSFLQGLTAQEFKEAVERNKNSVPAMIYKEPYTDGVMHYLRKKSGEEMPADIARRARVRRRRKKQVSNFTRTDVDIWGEPRHGLGVNNPKLAPDSTVAIELRGVYIELVRAAYQKQIDKGELDGRLAFVDSVLLDSLDFESDSAQKGEPLRDYEVVQVLSKTWSDRGDHIAKRFFNFLKCIGIAASKDDARAYDVKYRRLRVDVHIALSFIDAHISATDCFNDEFCDPPFEEEGKLVVRESRDQVRKAQTFLESQNQDDVKVIVSHLLCTILLNKFARYVESVTGIGFLKEREAAVYLEKIEEELEHIQYCTTDIHGDYDPGITVLESEPEVEPTIPEDEVVEEPPSEMVKGDDNNGNRSPSVSPLKTGISSRNLPRHVHGSGPVW